MPRPAERQILVRDLLTHSSGLPRMPPGFAPRDATDPYAELTEAELLTALGRVELGAAAPTYSNFGMMLVSLAVAHAYGSDYETALCERLFVPLKMGASYVSRPRGPVAAATGHLSSGAETPAWHVTTNLAGAGLVRASLEDMVKYAQAQLGLGDGALIARVRMTQKPLQAGYGMGWGRFKLQEHELAGHEGGTGGFSSLVLVDLTARRAVVILADTSLADLGGLRDLGNVLLGLRQPPLRPRTEATPSAELLAAMTGEYEASGISGRLWLDGKKLMAQLAGRPAFELHYDSRGDFYPKDFAGLLTPELHDGQVDRVTWRQGGSVIEAIRKGGSITPPAASTSPRGSASEPVQRL